ncbi:hypothetical protein H6A37_05660 [Phocaeicola plebeius]|uniref:DUF5723 family protein n=1 Tax=Phocaeicola plebeius TaxID=310297 RepID=UPI001958F530|nr:DUF5723 family protein [Phocaeicola plebeius]MBM6963319.1 hypothetical protein [Phocaeicola plebeius]
MGKLGYKGLLLLGGMMMLGGAAQAQYLRSSYFMEGTSARLQLNPGLQPTKGYFNMPIIGSFNMSASSNVLGTSDIIDLMDSGSDLYSNDKLFDRLKADNRLNVNLNTDILSFGWYRGKGFWSVNVGLRADFGAALAKDMFSMMRTMNGFALEDVAGTNQSYSLSNQTLNMKAYAEVGLGYSRRITEKLTVGGRVKVLLGLARAEMNINQFDLNLDVPNLRNYQDDASRGELSPSDWYGKGYSYAADGNVITTLKGGGMTFDNNGMIDNFDLDAGDLGIAGSGFGIDLGASYKVWDNLTVSASILDLGFLKWKESETTVATVSGGDEVTINSENYDRYIGGDFLSFERFDFEEGSPEKVKTKTRLYSTLLLAGEYGLLNNKLSVGAMYTARFAEPKTLNELTFLATFRPKNWLNAAISYSPIQASGKSIGLAVKLGPLFVGTDYMFFGGNSKSVNGFLGISFPLGGKPKPFSEL